MPRIALSNRSKAVARLPASLLTTIAQPTLSRYRPKFFEPETAAAAAQMPILLIHSRTDDFTPYTHSEAIYANSDQSRTVLHVNDWGSPHAADIATDFAAYQALVDAFLAQYAPDFGTPGG